MSMREIREHYGVPAKRGMRVMAWSDDYGALVPRRGTITSARLLTILIPGQSWIGWRLMVRLGDGHAPHPHHPHDLRYYGDDGQQIWPREETT
jgi:hypothetical protein